MTPKRKDIFSKNFETFAITLRSKPYEKANSYVAAPYSEVSTMIGRWAGLLAIIGESNGKSYSVLGMDMLDTIENLKLRANELELKFVDNTT
jgi:hypothetical protein